MPTSIRRQRLGRDRGEVRLQDRPAGVRRSTTSVDPVVELQLGLLAQVLDGPLQLAGVALGPQLGRQLRVDDHDQALVVGDGGARPRRGLDLDLVRREGHAAQVDRAVGKDLEPSLARAAAMTAGICDAELPADLRAAAA